MKSAICRAKDPTQCPYHGAVIRMYDAARKEDFNAFEEAKLAVQKHEQDPRTEEELLTSIYVSLADETPATPAAPVAPAAAQPETSIGYLERVVGDFEPSAGTETPDYFLADDQMGGKVLFVNSDASERPLMAATFVRIELDRPLDQGMESEEHEKLAGILGFMNKSIIHSKESLGENWWVDTDNSIVARLDFNNSSNYFRAMDMFSAQLEGYVEDGSPSRVDGTQLISGLKDEPKASLWYGYDPHVVADQELDVIRNIAEEKGL